MRIRISDIVLTTLLFVFVVSLPLDYFATKFGLDNVSILAISVCLKALLAIYTGFIIKRSGLRIFGIARFKELCLFIPFLLACVSNLSIVFFQGQYTVATSINGLGFFLNVLSALLTAFIEETIFRLFILNSLSIRNRLVRIIASAGIFAGFHLINLISPNITNGSFVVSVLIQVVYTFGLGILLGFIYEYGQSFTCCVVFHFLFNFINTIVYALFTPLSAQVENNVLYCCIGVGAVLIIYCTLLYFFVLRKKYGDETVFY